METIDQLKQENEKLNARLSKAVEVFKEQKANLDNLTSQVESLQKELETYKNAPVTDVSEYENKITLLEEDNIKLSEQNHLLEEKIQQSLEVSKSYNDQLLTIDKLTKQNEDLQKQLNEYELKLQNSETNYEQLHKKYEERKKQVSELMGSQAANVETIKNEYELKLQKLEGDYKDLKKVYEDERSEYENKITLLEEDNIKLSKDNDDYKKYIETLKEDANKLKENNDNFEKEYKSLEIINDDLNKQIDRLEAKVNELLASEAQLSSDNDILRKSDKNFREAYAKEKEENTALNTALGEAEEQYDKLMIQCEKYNKFISVIIATAEEYNYINTQHNDQKETVNKNNQNNTGNVFMKDAPEFTI